MLLCTALNVTHCQYSTFENFLTLISLSQPKLQQEIKEAGFMAVVMHGEPAYMYMSPLLQALNEFMPEKDRTEKG